MSSGTATTQLTEESPKYRVRVARACETCKTSHLSCGTERPCPRCIKAGVGHLCVDSTPKRRQKKIRNPEEENAIFFSAEMAANRKKRPKASRNSTNMQGEHEDMKREPNSSSLSPHFLQDAILSSPSSSSSPSIPFSKEGNVSENDSENNLEVLSHNLNFLNGNLNENLETIENLFEPVTPSDFSKLDEEIAINKEIQQLLHVSQLNHDEVTFNLAEAEEVRERVVKHFVRCQWMAEREARTCIQALQGTIFQRSALLRSLTPEQRAQVEVEKELKFQMTKNNVAQNPMPTLMFNDVYELVYANEAFRELTGLPDSVMGSLLGGLQLFQFSPETIREAIWGYITPVSGPEVYPSFVRMFSNRKNYKTVKIGEHDFLEGTSWAMRYSGPFESIIFSTRQFMPAPSTIQ